MTLILAESLSISNRFFLEGQACLLIRIYFKTTPVTLWTENRRIRVFDNLEILKVPGIREILFGLTAVQYWVLCYLVFLSEEQGKNNITFPRPGEEKRAEKKVSYKLMLRTLDELNDKRELLNIMVSKPEPQKIEVYIPIWLIKILSEHIDSTKKFAP